MRKRSTNKRFLISSSLIGLIIAVCCSKLYAHTAVNHIINFNTERVYAPGLNTKVLQLALTAYKKVRAAGVGVNEYLTIVDYSMPSTAPRLWVINMQTKHVIYNTHVAHGQGSGGNYATKFSNAPGSRMSSLGMFITGDIYNGHYGKSLDLHGLEKNFNSNAHMRRIVFHRAHYVDEAAIKHIGRLGRSFGCLALNKKIADKIMNTIKGGSYVFCYYPDSKWLKESELL
jgi:hypothetical protein